VRRGRWKFTQLFVNGLRRFRPRLPKQGTYRFAAIPQAAPGYLNRWEHGPDRAAFKPGELAQWKRPTDIKLVALQLWFDMHHRIKRLDMRKQEVVFRCKSLGSLLDEKQEPARYWVENVFEALDSPGEWYLDRPSGTLYYIPGEKRTLDLVESEEMDRAEIVAPRLETILRLQGTDRRPVSFIRFENLAFEHAEWDYPPDDCGSVQAAYKAPGAVIFDRAERCALYGCAIAHVAQYGVEMLAGCHGNRVMACSIYDTGAGGVKVGHEWIAPRAATSAAGVPRRRRVKPMAAVVSDCSIHHGGIIHLSAVGVWVGNAGHNRILHNHIHDYNYTGISCGWTWGFDPTATIDNRIEYNHVHHINWNEILSDNGGIYTLGIQPGTIVRGNHLHHVSCYGYGGWGLYPDEGSSEILFEDNLVHHTKHAGFSGHYGRDMVVRNNIFALSRSAHIGLAGQIKDRRFHVFERNILYWREGQLQSSFWSSIGWPLRCSLLRNNCFWGGGIPVDFGPEGTLADWQALGQHLGTVVADPLFGDPESEDFSLRRDSPALATGFKPFDWRQAGPRLDRRRPLRVDGWPVEPDKPRPIVRSKLVLTRRGARLTLENVGSAPASGSLRINARPVVVATVEGRETFAFKDLKPRAKISTDFRLRARDAISEYWVETHPLHGEGLIPTFAMRVGTPVWDLPRLAPLADASAVRAALAALPARGDPTFARQPAAIRLAVAGDCLALHAAVTDRDIRPEKLAWQGSAVILYGASDAPLPEGAPPHPIGQVFLVPGAGDTPPYCAIQDGPRQKPAPSIRFACAPTTDGYDLAALVPLERLKIPPAAQSFRLEVAVSTTPPRSRRVRSSLCRAVSPHLDASGQARVRVKEPV
jgi:hypothetical protein